ncbi:hypothetical protein [Sphingobium xenophagum]|uniref:hypothetical protein n=1 Tax=Sphingobium xenophagum TaxID=121428 RepID=UPI0012FDD03C|nr:hypothetical protein [Sphingobium xenophagum]
MTEEDIEPSEYEMTDDEADEVVREAIHRRSDLSLDPTHPNYDFRVMELNQLYQGKFNEDFEGPIRD